MKLSRGPRSPWMSRVASPPSSTSRSGPSPSAQVSACSVHHQYSSSVSPFHANTEAESRAMAAAAWSWVEKMLHEHQRTSAPRAASVSIRTAVCGRGGIGRIGPATRGTPQGRTNPRARARSHRGLLPPSWIQGEAQGGSKQRPAWMVMCRDPAILAPLKGLAGPYSVRHAIRPGISTSASSISMRPKSACVMSATLYCRPAAPCSTTHLALGAVMLATSNRRGKKEREAELARGRADRRGGRRSDAFRWHASSTRRSWAPGLLTPRIGCQNAEFGPARSRQRATSD